MELTLIDINKHERVIPNPSHQAVDGDVSLCHHPRTTAANGYKVFRTGTILSSWPNYAAYTISGRLRKNLREADQRCLAAIRQKWPLVAGKHAEKSSDSYTGLAVNLRCARHFSHLYFLRYAGHLHTKCCCIDQQNHNMAAGAQLETSDDVRGEWTC